MNIFDLMPPPTIVGRKHRVLGLTSVRCPLTAISRDTLSLDIADELERNLAQYSLRERALLRCF